VWLLRRMRLRVKPLFELFERGDVRKRPKAQSKEARLGRAPKIQFPGGVGVDQLQSAQIFQVARLGL